MVSISQRLQHGGDSLFILGLVEDIGEATLAAILAVEHGGHEDAGSTLLGGTLASETVDLAVVVDLVVLQHSELDLPLLVLDLLGSGVILLLPLLGSSPEPEDEMKGRLLLDVVVGECTAILQLLTSEDQSRQYILEKILCRHQLYLC